jgi:hypothetical protein
MCLLCDISDVKICPEGADTVVVIVTMHKFYPLDRACEGDISVQGLMRAIMVWS